MPNDGVQIGNLPARSLTHVLGVEDVAGKRSTGLQTIEEFVQYLLGLAGLDPSGIADVSLRLAQEVARAGAAENALDTKVNQVNFDLDTKANEINFNLDTKINQVNLDLTNAIADARETTVEGLDAEAAARRLVAVSADRADGPRRQLGAAARIVTGINRLSMIGNFYGPGGFQGWTVGIRPPRAVPNPRAVGFWLYAPEAATFEIKVYSRLASLPLGNPAYFAWPGGPDAPADALLFEATYPLRDLTPFVAAGVPQPIDFPIDPGPMSTDKIYFPVLTAKDASGNPVSIGISRGRNRLNDSFDPIWKAGVGRGADGTLFGPPADGGMIAYALYEHAYKEGYPLASSAVSRVNPVTPFKVIQTAKANSTTYAVTPPALEIGGQPNPLLISDGTGVVGIEVPAVNSVSSEAVTLTFGSAAQLSRQYVDNVVITAGGSPFVQGVDYTLNKVLGQITGLKNVGPIAATAAYDWSPHRYDLIVADPDTGTVQVARGTDRILDPNEYMPTAPGYLPIARVYVHRFGTEVLPVCEWAGFVKRGREAEYADRIAYNRSRLPRAMALLKAGAPLRLGGLGDSNTAIAGSAAMDFFSPNGNRDLYGHFSSRYPADTLATIPRFDGPAGPQAHVRVGWNWALKAALERRYGSLIEYRNWSIPGTSADDQNPGGVPNGRFPQRLNAYLADGCDLTVLAFGMNSLGNGYVYNYTHTLALIRSIQAAGGEVIVLTVPRPNTAAGWVIDDWWLITNRAIVDAARDADAAYVDFTEIAGPGNEAGIGVSAQSACAQNVYNHPGFYEFARYGAYLAETFVR